eukprot:scpid16041/ scgid4564/ Myoblast growth factor receptor egl-15; Egg-laying defective protein 15
MLLLEQRASWLLFAALLVGSLQSGTCWSEGFLGNGGAWRDIALDACEVIPLLLGELSEENCSLPISAGIPGNTSSCCDLADNLTSLAPAQIRDAEAAWDESSSAWYISWTVHNTSQRLGLPLPSDLLFMVCISSPHGTCSELCNSTADFFLTDSSRLHVSENASYFVNRQVAVSSFGLNSSLTKSTPVRFRPGAVRNVNISSQYYDQIALRPLVNISWDDPVGGQDGRRTYNVQLQEAILDIPIQNLVCNMSFSRTHFAGNFLQLPLITLLAYGCTYDLIIVANPTSDLEVIGANKTVSIQLESGLVDARDLSGTDVLCDNINRAFRPQVLPGVHTIRVRWDLESFDPDVLLVPLVDLLGSLVQVNSVVLNRRSGKDLFRDSSIDPYLYPTGNASYLRDYCVTTPEIRVTFDISLRLAFRSGNLNTYSLTCRSSYDIGLSTITGSGATTSLIPSPRSQGTEDTTSLLPLYIILPLVAVLMICSVILAMYLRFRQSRQKQLDTGFHNEAYAEGELPEVPAAAVREKDEYEVSPDQLTMLSVLGSGSFGVVLQATLQTSDENGQAVSMIVAAKTLLDSASESDRDDLIQEIGHMKDFSHHPHLVRLIACCTLADPIYLIAEWIPHGNLKELLRHTYMTIKQSSFSDDASNELKREDEVGQEEDDLPVIALDGKHLNVTELYGFAHQIADGMEHLAQMRYVHRDLATRNILVGRGKQLKIADFGMTRDVYDESAQIYVKQGHGRVPIRWMAIESLIMRAYTCQSDVWSYGVVLWELCTFASLPYSEIKNNELVRLLKAGGRLKKPSGCTEDIYNLMHACWSELPEERPTFTDILEMLTELLFPLVTSSASSGQGLNSMDGQLNDGIASSIPAAGPVSQRGPAVNRRSHRHHRPDCGCASEDEMPYVDVNNMHDTDTNDNDQEDADPLGNHADQESAPPSQAGRNRRRSGTSQANGSCGEVQPVRDAPDLEYARRASGIIRHSPSLSSGSSYNSDDYLSSSESEHVEGEPPYLKVY